ncbi:MAG: hypothetical protein AB7K24_01710 [Gemmataceae bacterium]
MTGQERLQNLIQNSEFAHHRMFTASSISDAAGRFEEAKRSLQAAIALAENMGDSNKVVWLEHRLTHVTGIYRSRFSRQVKAR